MIRDWRDIVILATFVVVMLILFGVRVHTG